MSLTATGLERPRLNDLKADLDASVSEALGPVNVGPDSVLGQIDGIHAAALDDIYELAQDVYDSMYPSSAEGVSLDRAVSFLGLVRLSAAPDVVTAAVYGAQGTNVPVNALAHADIQYFNSSRVTITRFNAIDAYLSIPAVTDSTVYSVTLDSTTYSFNSGIGATLASIIAGLVAAIGAGYKAVAANGGLRISATDGETPFVITGSGNVVLDLIGSPAVFVAVSSGARSLPIGALSNIDTPVFGWSGISNLITGSGSRNVESDVELRLRHSTASRATGSATVKAIRARLLAEVPGVTAVSVYENRSMYIVNSMPAHSFETVVQGGVDQLVGQNIWDNKPAGIETYGNTLVTVTDDNGESQPVEFSRPVSQYLWVRVTVTDFYPEEDLPDDTVQAIKAAVVATAQALTVGEDVITQRFIGPIYAATSGIGMINVETAITAGPSDTPTYSTANKAIGRSDLAVASESRAVVNGL